VHNKQPSCFCAPRHVGMVQRVKGSAQRGGVRLCARWLLLGDLLPKLSKPLSRQ